MYANNALPVSTDYIQHLLLVKQGNTPLWGIH